MLRIWGSSLKQGRDEEKNLRSRRETTERMYYGSATGSDVSTNTPGKDHICTQASRFELARKVTVWGKRYTISVFQSSKTVWVAKGEYNGKSIEVKNRTANSAVQLWRDAAEFRGI